jgi:hypothetical protein
MNNVITFEESSLQNLMNRLYQQSAAISLNKDFAEPTDDEPNVLTIHEFDEYELLYSEEDYLSIHFPHCNISSVYLSNPINKVEVFKSDIQDTYYIDLNIGGLTLEFNFKNE